MNTDSQITNRGLGPRNTADARVLYFDLYTEAWSMFSAWEYQTGVSKDCPECSSAVAQRDGEALDSP